MPRRCVPGSILSRWRSRASSGVARDDVGVAELRCSGFVVVVGGRGRRWRPGRRYEPVAAGELVGPLVERGAVDVRGERPGDVAVAAAPSPRQLRLVERLVDERDPLRDLAPGPASATSRVCSRASARRCIATTSAAVFGMLVDVGPARDAAAPRSASPRPGRPRSPCGRSRPWSARSPPSTLPADREHDSARGQPRRRRSAPHAAPAPHGADRSAPTRTWRGTRLPTYPATRADRDRAVVDDPRARRRARRAARHAGRLLPQRVADLVHRRGADARVAAAPGRRVRTAGGAHPLRPLGARRRRAARRADAPTRSCSGAETRPLASLWEGLECFPAYGDDLEPATLVPAGHRAARHRAPDLCGLVDHDRVGDAWEAAHGRGLDRPSARRSAGALTPGCIRAPVGRQLLASIAVIRVVVAEDSLLVREGIAKLLERAGRHRGRGAGGRPPVAARGGRGRPARRRADRHPHAADRHRRRHPGRRTRCARPTPSSASSCSRSTPSRRTRSRCSSEGSERRGVPAEGAGLGRRPARRPPSARSPRGGSVIDPKVVEVLVTARSRAADVAARAPHAPRARGPGRDRPGQEQRRRRRRARAVASGRSRSTSTRCSPSSGCPRSPTPTAGSRPCCSTWPNDRRQGG